MGHGEITLFYNIGLVLIAFFVFVFGILLFFSCKKKPIKAEETLPVSVPPSSKLCATSYSLMDIDAATDGFNTRRIIGKGRLGTVYAAVMPRGDLVAVKRIHPRLVLTNAGFGFSSSIKSLSLADHPHVVPIIGYSEGPGERIIVMEYEGMISLEFYLHHNLEDGAVLLDWNQRIKIAAGVARGIEYLHNVQIVHGCIKPSNILIDGKFRARIGDYGLQFLEAGERQGILGYVDDEYWVMRKNGASKENDVYGLGVVLIELLSGRKCEEGMIVNWGLPLIKQMKFDELLDQRLGVPSDVKPLGRLAKVALACVGNSRPNRPSISQIVTILNNVESESL
ncbi:OLC1v1021442C1 [Oldenlandia corymbosa var. corymbosa]|uniref:OLC1v1021442C1 n=1 Tax=Oldenlandia corymbosa var. corymbosa TaxID=529605 RepID=A0AAV1BVP2_OLDCO|nr:OLC1v1021442C1 [Oldenlandia corymbosa var. corymbosa]